MAKRRVVTLCRWTVQREAGTGRSGQLFAFSWRDIAALLGVQVDTAQKMAKAKRFDPTDLASLAAFWAERRADDLEIGEDIDFTALARIAADKPQRPPLTVRDVLQQLAETSHDQRTVAAALLGRADPRKADR